MIRWIIVEIDAQYYGSKKREKVKYAIPFLLSQTQFIYHQFPALSYATT